MSDITQPTGTVEERVARAKEATSRISLPDTEPLDLDAVYARWIDWYNNEATTADWTHRDPDESLSHCLAREDVPALIAEVRRLREEVDTEHAGHMAAVGLLQDKEAEVRRLREKNEADGAWLRGLLAMVGSERDDFAKRLGIEPEWTEADA